jgi:uncharacterized protein YcaQ
MSTPTISKELARRIAIHSQAIDNHAKFPAGKEGVAQLIERLGYIQIDTISVIERAHHHTIWNRFQEYIPDMLDELQANDRHIFEYWGHAASYLPIKDYRFYLPLKQYYEDPNSKWEKDRQEKYGHMMKPVLERIRNEGPLGSKDFEPPEGAKKGEWWNWRPTKVALELLFWKGDLMITRRDKFNRIYDLTERVLPNDVDTTFPTEEELGQFIVKRALNAYGVATEKNICDHLHIAKKPLIKNALKAMVKAGLVIKIDIEGIDKPQYFACQDIVDVAEKLPKVESQVHLLSPFDNLIILRDRMELLFDFDYALECYVTPAKRKFGYFTLPILYNEELVGRLDSKADRKPKTLIIRNLSLESENTNDGDFLQLFADKLWKFALFNGCEKVTLEKVNPTKMKKSIQKSLKEVM